MTASAVIASIAAGAFLLLCIVTWYLVLALKQARQSALAVEQFLNSTRPRIEVATEHLGSLVGRTDRFLASLEDGRGGFRGALGLVDQAFSGWAAGAQAVSAISAAVGALVQTWSLFAQPSASREAQATAGGGTHE